MASAEKQPNWWVALNVLLPVLKPVQLVDITECTKTSPTVAEGPKCVTPGANTSPTQCYRASQQVGDFNLNFII